ncbi:T9SS type A sorting domain-containing protein [uncultured Kordia sp.]|uniref:T9SS type A sorting domain-containing protein n=1 Tax=uncultured Kordia sp. TaxID=507699 RepID=UPI00262E7285|nr:T9SS type A sorting domain-containing protein [uncultured Kordia sp.]
MKLKLLVFLFPLCLLAQVNSNYVELNSIPKQTETLVTETAPFSVLKNHADYQSMHSLLQAAKELSHAGKTTPFLSIENNMRITSYNETIKIGGLYAEYEMVNPEAITNNDVILEGNTYKVRQSASETVFTKKEELIISPLSTHKHGMFTTFYVDRNLFNTEAIENFAQFFIDFDNGDGFQLIDFDAPILINYNSAGKKQLQFKVRLTSGEQKITSAQLIVHGNSQAENPENSQGIQASISPDLSIYTGATSFAGLGEYQVFLGAGNTDIIKPIIVIDGFDPSDTRGISDVYDLLTYTDNNGMTQNLADRIRAEENFDVIVLNLPQYLRLADNTLQLLSDVTDTNNDMIIDENDYPAGSTLVDGGADYIERNAMILVELINTINSQKVGTEQNVIIGPSMGGLISRYALNYMENAPTLDHDTRLWISFDSPHLGANVPIGFQHLFNYLAYGLDTWVGDFSVESLRPIVDGMLKSPAARQMLTDHMEAHLQSGQIAEFDNSIVLPTAHPFSGLFFNRINGLTTSGYPESLRKISIINGSGNGAYYQDKNGANVLPGRQVLDVTINGVALLTDAHLKVWYTHDANVNDEVSNIWIDAPFLCFCDINANANSRSHSYSNGIDAAMGGLFDLGALSGSFAGGDPTIDAFFAGLQTDYFNFIPTISSMGLKNQNNWYAVPNPNNGSIVNESPFDAWYMPPTNEGHVILTDPNVQFAWNEIVAPTLSTPIFEQSNTIQLAENPIKNSLKLIIKKPIDELAISIYDVSGRNIFATTETSIQSTLEVPISLQSGVYLAHLSYEGKKEIKKLIIE